MAIGTSRTALQLQINKNLTRHPQQHNNIVLELLKSVAIIAVSALAAKFTGGISLNIAIKYGLSNFAAQSIASTIKFATEFAINQLYDQYNEQSTTLSTILNLTPAIGEMSKISRAYKATKILKLAKEHKIINYLGINTANNLEEIINQVSGQKIIIDKYKLIYDYSKKPTKETIMSHLGFLTRKEFITNYKTADTLQLGQLLELETILRKINPNLVTKTRVFKEKLGNKLLTRFGTNTDEISQIPTEKWLSLISQMQQTGIRPGTILSLNTLRSENIFRSQFLKQMQKLIKKTKKINPRYHINRYLKFETPKAIPKQKYTLKYLDYQIQKNLSKVFKPIRKLRQYIKNFESKIEKQIKDYFDYKKIFTKVRNKIINDAILIPLISNTFFAVKVKKTGILNDVAIIIYYKNPENGFIGPIITTPIKLNQLLTVQSPFNYYMYHSGWSIGWGKKHGSNLPIMNFLPASVHEFYVNSVKFYKILAPLLKVNFNKKMQQKDFFNPKKRAKKFISNNYIDWSIDASLGKGYVGKAAKKYVVWPIITKKTKLSIKPEKRLKKKINQKFSKISKNLNRKW